MIGTAEKTIAVMLAVTSLIALAGAYRRHEVVTFPLVMVFMAILLPVLLVFWAYRTPMPDDRRIRWLVGLLLVCVYMGTTFALSLR
jgi:Ca2+/Na+ antiporter